MSINDDVSIPFDTERMGVPDGMCGTTWCHGKAAGAFKVSSVSGILLVFHCRIIVAFGAERGRASCRSPRSKTKQRGYSVTSSAMPTLSSTSAATKEEQEQEERRNYVQLHALDERQPYTSNRRYKRSKQEQATTEAETRVDPGIISLTYCLRQLTIAQNLREHKTKHNCSRFPRTF